jgi:hypothetical protein
VGLEPVWVLVPAVAGFTQDEVDRMDLPSLGDEGLQEIVRKRLLKTETEDRAKEKAVSVSEVNRYLAQGWEYVASLPNKTVIIRSRT